MLIGLGREQGGRLGSSASPSHSCLCPPLPVPCLPGQRLSRERLPGQSLSALTGGNTGLQSEGLARQNYTINISTSSPPQQQPHSPELQCWSHLSRHSPISSRSQSEFKVFLHCEKLIILSLMSNINIRTELRYQVGPTHFLSVN